MYLNVCVYNEFWSWQKWQKMKLLTFQPQPVKYLTFTAYFTCVKYCYFIIILKAN